MKCVISKWVWLPIGSIVVILIVITIIFVLPAYLRFVRFQGYVEGLEQQFLFDANKLQHSLANKAYTNIYCRIYSVKHGPKIKILSPEQSAQARLVLMKLLSCNRMQPSFLRVSEQHVAPMGYISFFITEQDAERNENSVVFIDYYEFPNAVLIHAAMQFDVNNIDMLLDQTINAEVKNLIEKMSCDGYESYDSQPKAESDPQSVEPQNSGTT